MGKGMRLWHLTGLPLQMVIPDHPRRIQSFLKVAFRAKIEAEFSQSSCNMIQNPDYNAFNPGNSKNIDERVLKSFEQSGLGLLARNKFMSLIDTDSDQ